MENSLDERVAASKWDFLGLARDHANLFKRVYRDIHARGRLSSPRGQLIKELENYSFDLPPYVRFTSFKCRKFNLRYVKEELKWYLRGDRFDTSIAETAGMWKDLINDDGSIDSNYGQYVFTGGQFDRVVETLRGDLDSRRAVIVILNSDHLVSGSKDIPCTYGVGFRVRDGKLNMTVRMRSNDAIFGLSNDVPFFSFLHEMVLNALQEFYPGVEYGTYHHSADSMHVYERHFELLGQLVSDHIIVGGPQLNQYSLVRCPRILGEGEVRFLRAGDFTNIPDSYEFTQWLNKSKEK